MGLPTAKLFSEGAGLRRIRRERHFTLKRVEQLSAEIAGRQDNPSYRVTAGRLSQIENNNSLPGLFKLASLSEIYRVPYRELLRLYGVRTDA